MVGAKGLEPSWVSPLAPKASAYTSFATRPLFFVIPATCPSEALGPS